MAQTVAACLGGLGGFLKRTSFGEAPFEKPAQAEQQPDAAECSGGEREPPGRRP